MKATLIIFIISIESLTHAAMFQNLDFEQANTNNVVSNGPGLGGGGLASELLPHWSLLNGGVTGLGLDAFPLDGDVFTLATRNGGNQFFSTSVFPIQGNYAMFISAAICMEQTGTIPLNAGQIQFLTFGYPTELRVNGNILPLTYTYFNPTPIADSLRYGTAVGDISAFAGTDVELSFSTITVSALYNIHGIDDIQFVPIPEPSTLALCGLGIFLIATRLRQKRA